MIDSFFGGKYFAQLGQQPYFDYLTELHAQIYRQCTPPHSNVIDGEYEVINEPKQLEKHDK